MNLLTQVTTAALGGVMLALAWVASVRRPVAASAGSRVRFPSPPAVAKAGTFRVGCYNIHRGKGIDGRKDIRRIARVIDRADLVGLCEVEGPAYGLVASQAQQLGRRIGLGWLFSPTQRRWMRFDRGNGLLTRYNVHQWYHEPLVDSTGRRSRILTTVQIDIGGEPVTVMVTHLSRNADQQIQLRTVLDRFVQYDRAILVGDFNVSRGFSILRGFLKSGHGVDAIREALGEEDDPVRIDWVLVRGLRVCGGGQSHLGPSDHPYYWVDVRLANPAAVAGTAVVASAGDRDPCRDRRAARIGLVPRESR